MSCSKRKHKNLSLKEKMEVLRKLDSGESLSEVAQFYGMGRATVHDLKKNRLKFMEHVKSMGNISGNRKTFKKGLFPKMEAALYQWYLKERDKRSPISGDILRAKAKEFYKNLSDKDDFAASGGWLDKFKKRHGIRLSTMQSKKEPDIIKVLHTADQFLNKVKQLNLLPDQVYNMYDTSMLWKFMHSDRIKVMACCNATGSHKLDLLVIGKHKSPKAGLPVYYKKQSESEITVDIVIEWFHEEFVPSIRNFMKMCNLPERGLLVFNFTNVSGISEQLCSHDEMVQAMLIPPECTFENQNVIQTIKSQYKKKMLLHIVGKGANIKQNVKLQDLGDAVFSLADAWYSVPPVAIRSSWKTFWPIMDISEEEIEEDDSIPIANLVECVLERDNAISRDNLTDWLLETAEEKCKTEVNTHEESETSAMTEPVESDVAFLNLSSCISWAEGSGVSTQDIMVLRRLRETAFRAGFCVKKEVLMHDYFIKEEFEHYCYYYSIPLLLI